MSEKHPFVKLAEKLKETVEDLQKKEKIKKYFSSDSLMGELGKMDEYFQKTQEDLHKVSPPGMSEKVEKIKRKLRAEGMSEERSANIAFGTAWNEYKGKK